MIKYNRLPDNILRLLPRAVSYLKHRSDVAFAYLFGSLAQGEPKPLSDVDIAIYLLEENDTAERKLDILGHLMDLLETEEVDLVILNTAHLALKMKILETKNILVDNLPFVRHSYESLTMREYFDFAIKEMAILERRFLSG